MSAVDTPLLSTPRLTLRPYREEDRAWSVAFFGEEEVFRYAAGGALAPAAASALFDRVFEVYREGRFSVWLAEEAGERVGHAELKPRAGEPGLEVVYFLAPRAQGRGLGGELVDALLARAAELRSPVLATVHPDNARSIRLLEKKGFRLDKTETDEDGTTLFFRRP